MNLIDENIEKEESESKQKKFKIIIISIIALIVLAIVIVIISVVRNNNTIKFSLDGESKAFNSGMFMMTESALTKLMWILGQTQDFEEAEKLFYTTIYHDILYKD